MTKIIALKTLDQLFINPGHIIIEFDPVVVVGDTKYFYSRSIYILSSFITEPEDT